MMAKRWLITGAAGMLGTDLCDLLRSRGEEVVATDRFASREGRVIDELDITGGRAATAAIREISPAIIVNCAAFTRVDAAEEEESAANMLNGAAVEFLAHAADSVGALLVQLSTDFVFDGTKRTPYEVDDETHPVSVYGRSKLLGEIAARRADRHLIVRTSWLFGKRGPNFVEAIRNQIAKGTSPLRVVDDQRGRPTYTPHLAAAIVRLAERSVASEDDRGVFHYADDGECSWFDFAKAIVEESSADTRIIPVSTSEFPRPAKRPAYSVLSTSRYEQVTGVKPEKWRDGLREYLNPPSS